MAYHLLDGSEIGGLAGDDVDIWIPCNDRIYIGDQFLRDHVGLCCWHYRLRSACTAANGLSRPFFGGE